MPGEPRKLVGTLAKLAASGRALTVNWLICLHRSRIDLPARIRATGAAYRVQAFIERAVCSKCGARWPRLSATITQVSAPEKGPSEDWDD
jgi:hypothetical protein